VYSFIPAVIDDESCKSIGGESLRRAASRFESESEYRCLEVGKRNVRRHRAEVCFLCPFLRKNGYFYIKKFVECDTLRNFYLIPFYILSLLSYKFITFLSIASEKNQQKLQEIAKYAKN